MSDSILEGFGEPVEQVEEEQYQDKLKKISPFFQYSVSLNTGSISFCLLYTSDAADE